VYFSTISFWSYTQVSCQKEEKKEEKKDEKKADSKAIKVGRRLSARVGDFFKSKPKAEVAAPAKINENPPVIDEPTPVAPLENPATEAAAAPEPTVEEPVEAAPAAAPVVAAAA
jgi:hypothetical protein